MALITGLRLTAVWLSILTVVKSNTSTQNHTSSSVVHSNASLLSTNSSFSLQSSFAIATDVGFVPDHLTSHEVTSSASTPLNLYPKPSSPSDHDAVAHISDSNLLGASLRFPHQAQTSMHRSRRDNVLPAPKCVKAPLARRIGYYQVSNVRKRLCHRITPAEIVTDGLTHLYFAYAGIDQNNYAIVPSHPDDVRLYGELSSRKTASMQTWIAVGGYDFGNTAGPTYQTTLQTWQLMTSSTDRRAAFIKSVGEFMRQYSFQGVDLAWQYPSARGGSANDAANLVALVREMRSAWGKNYGISATIPPDAAYLDRFDAKGMESYVDFFGYLSYDFPPPSGSEGTVQPHTDIREIEKVTAALWADHLDPKKLNLGLSYYGRGYTLADRSCPRSGCKVSGPSKSGLCTNTAGLLFNIEINDIIKQRGLKSESVPNTMSKQISWDDQWIGFDDEETMAQKTDWAAERCFGGTMIWSLDMNSGEGSGSTPDQPGQSSPGTSQSSPGKSIVPVPMAPGKSTTGASILTAGTSIDYSGTSGLASTQSGYTVATVVSPPIVSDQSSADESTSGRTDGASSSIRSGQQTLPATAASSNPSQSTSHGSTSSRPNAAASSTQSGQSATPLIPAPIAPGKSSSRSSTLDSSIASTSSGKQTAAVIPVAATSSQLSSHTTTDTKTSTQAGQQTSPVVLPIPAAPGKSTTDLSTLSQPSTSAQSKQSGQSSVSSSHTQSSGSSSSHSSGTTSLSQASTQSKQSGLSSASSSTGRSSERTGPSSSHSSGTTSSGQSSSQSKQSGLSSVSSSHTQSSGSSSSHSSGTTSASQPVLRIPGVDTIPSPTIAPDSVITEGPESLSNLIVHAVSFEIGISYAQDDLSAFSGESPSSKRDRVSRRQVRTPMPEEVKLTLQTLAPAYASLGLLEKEIALLNLTSLPADIRKIVENVRKGLPGIDSGTKAGITNLADSIKDGKQVNMEDIKKANSLLGDEGSVTQQVDLILRPLTNWVAPQGSNKIVISGTLTLATPSLGDGWKGTTVSAVVTVASPTIAWNATLLYGIAGAGAGAGAGLGLLAGLASLAKQAEGSVQAAGDLLTSLSGKASIAAGDVVKAASALTSATENVGGYGAALDAVAQDAIEMTTFDERFPPASLNQVVNAQNKAKGLFVNLNRALNNIAQFINKPPQALAAIKAQAPKWVPGGLIAILLAGTNSGTILSLPKPIPMPSIVRTNTTNSTDPNLVDDYFLVTVPDTTPKAFQDFIRTLPDGGRGPQAQYEWPRRYQTYLGRMTRKQAEAVNHNRITAVIGLNRVTVVDGDWRRPAPAKDDKSRLVARRPNWRLEQNIAAPLHQSMLSYWRDLGMNDLNRKMEIAFADPANHQGRGEGGEGYIYEQSAGLGVTVSLFSKGFDMQHQDFNRPGHITASHVPRAVDLRADSVEGDQVAALIVGVTLGIAPNADLNAIKTITHEADHPSNQDIYDNWHWALNYFQEVKAHGGNQKGVFCYTHGVEWHEALEDNNHVDYERWGLRRLLDSDFFLPLLVDAWEADVVTVFPTGDDHDRPTYHSVYNRQALPMGELSPMRHANPRNPIIVVGSVDRQMNPSFFSRRVGGRRATTGSTSYRRDRDLQGEITVSTLGEEVDVIRPGTQWDYEITEGGSTAFAAAQIAGLAAYHLGVPGVQYAPGTVAQATKDWIVANKRRLVADGGTSPDAPGIAYNGVDEITQFCYPGTYIVQPPPPAPPQPRSLASHFIRNLAAKIFSRQIHGNHTLERNHTVIFQDGHLTNATYSKLFPCKMPPPSTTSSRPKSTTSSSTKRTTSSTAKPTTSSKPAPPKSTPSSVPSSTTSPKPSTPSASNVVCFWGGEEHPNHEAFDLPTISDLIDRVCGVQKKYPFDVFAFGNNGQIAIALAAGVVNKGSKAFDKNECINSFHALLDICDKDSSAHGGYYGGSVDIATVDLYISANKVQPPQDLKCHLHEEKGPIVTHDDAIKIIQDVCRGHDHWFLWKQTFSDAGIKHPLLSMFIELAPKSVTNGFDEQFCIDGFTKLTNECSTDTKDWQWGGEATIENIQFKLWTGA